jgi:hypothetical protein
MVLIMAIVNGHGDDSGQFHGQAHGLCQCYGHDNKHRYCHRHVYGLGHYLSHDKHYHALKSSLCRPVLRIRIRDPVPFLPLDPGSGMGRKSASGSGIRYEQPGSYFLELRNHFFGVKILKFFDANPGSGIRDEDSSDPGSGMEKIRIRDKHPASQIRNTDVT